MKDNDYEWNLYHDMDNRSYNDIKKIEELEADLKEVASLILTTGYTVNDKGERVMDGNEYIWIDAAVAILKKYHKRK
jgi:hypothetical protein